MAAPHIAGIVAQLFQDSPGATPAQVETAIRSTAYKYSFGAPYEAGSDGVTTSFDKGAGLVDVVAAANALHVTLAVTDGAASGRVASHVVRFLDDAAPPHDLTYDDVFMVPRHSSVASRYDVDLSTADGTGATLPARRRQHDRHRRQADGRDGGPPRRARGDPAGHPDRRWWPTSCAFVKSRHQVFDTPIELRPDQTVAEALALIPKRAHRAAVVVDGRPARSAWSPRRTASRWTGSRRSSR